MTKPKPTCLNCRHIGRDKDGDALCLNEAVQPCHIPHPKAGRCLTHEPKPKG